MTTVDREQLLDSARDFAERALRAYAEDDARVILVNAAISMEHLSKAFLCDMNPVLLMEIRNGQFDSLLHLSRHGTKAKKLKAPRTISAREAVARVEHLLPSLTVPKDLLHQLVDVRDGVVHVGYLGEASTIDLMAAFLRYAEALYNELAVPEVDRWGSYLSLADSLIVKSLDAAAMRTQRKIALAMHRHTNRFRGLSDLERSIQQSRLWYDHSQRVEHDQYWTFVTCPACEDEHARLGGQDEPQVKSWDIEEINGRPVSPEIYTRWVLTVEIFECGVCGLTLDSADEVKAAGLETLLER